MTVAEQYAEYAANLTYDDLPDDVVDHAKKLLLDTIGLSAGAFRWTESGEPFVEGIRSLESAPGEGGATVLATGEGMAPEYAALLNGAIAHSLDYDDTHRESAVHPGAPVIPAALAAAEVEGASGRELLAGVVAGYEVTCRLGLACNHPNAHDRGFHPTGTCGVFGATAAAGRVFGLDPETLVNALGLNGSQASGSMQYLQNGSWNKRFHPGWAAHGALVSIPLARAGFRGTAAPIVGGDGFLNAYSDDPRPEVAAAGLGETYETLGTALKPHPCCRQMNNPLDLLLDLVEGHDVDPGEVERVTVEMPTHGAELVGRPVEAKVDPTSLVDAQFSMQFGAALAIAERDTGIDTFRRVIDDGYDGAFRALMERVRVVSSEGIDERYPERWPARVTVVADGEAYEAESEYAKGEPENPLSWGEHRSKFDEVTAGFPAPVRDAVYDRGRDVGSVSAADLVAPFRDAAEVRH